MKQFVGIAMSGVNTIVADHLKVFFRDVPDKPFDEIHGLRSDTGTGEEELDEQTKEQIIECIKNKKVAVLGGTEKWIRRMKRLLPAWSFIGAGEDSIGGLHALERADYIYIYTSALKHSQYYRAMNLVKSKGKMLFYLNGTNTSECLRQFHRELSQ